MPTTDSSYPEPNASYVYGKEHGECLHDRCSQCNGTGIRKDGLGACIHMISCSCQKCSPCRM